MDMPETAEHSGPERWRRIQDLFDHASTLPADSRSEWLDRACGGDASLRAEVASLLNASEGPAWLDQPVADALPQDPDGQTSSMASIPALDYGPLKPGSVLGPYAILSKIGEGGMGAVYQASDSRLNRIVAIKVITGGTSETERRRFALEARHVSALNHPNIVTIHEYDSRNGLDYIVMEYVQGVTLDRLMERKPPLTELLGYAAQAAGALEKAHRAGIVHRDLKPANIMVTAEGVVKVLDFGLARSAFDPTGTDRTQTLLTVAGKTVGTPAYMSPEQVRGEPVDHRSDIFSFGLLLHELVCGSRPFADVTGFALMESIARKAVPSVAGVAPGVSAPLAAIIDSCLANDKANRPNSMETVRSALLAVIEGQPTRPIQPALRSRRAIAGVGLLALILVTAVVWLIHRAPTAPRRVLSYSLLTQQPGGDAQPVRTDQTFHGGDRFHFRLESPQAGYFYLITEGVGENRERRYWILHVPEGLQPANKSFSTGTYVFDRNPGAERLWLLWAETRLPEVDAANNAAKAGEVTDPAQAERLGNFLRTIPPAVARAGGAGIQLMSDHDAFGSLIELRHQ